MSQVSDEQSKLVVFNSLNLSPEEASEVRAALEEAVAVWLPKVDAAREEIRRVAKDLEAQLMPHIKQALSSRGQDYDVLAKEFEQYITMHQEVMQRRSDSSEPSVLADPGVLEKELTAARKVIAQTLTSASTTSLSWPGTLVFAHTEGAFAPAFNSQSLGKELKTE